MATDNLTRLHLEIAGAVQGVGFRPYCHALARHFGLTGWVFNHGGGVSLEIQGHAVDGFIEKLTSELPPLSRIDRIDCHTIALQRGETGFVIRESQMSGVTAAIPPDSSVCPDCLRELFDPGSRYYRYAFLNCTHCGPRYTVTRQLPYDRKQTAMAPFALCAECQCEYDDINSRRFHAQPTACPACGPQLSMTIEEIVQHLCEGQILAIKGLGGFHLVCDARNHNALQRLRARKHRDAKPFAIMAANADSLEQLIVLDDATRSLLESPQRPIVVARRKPDANIPTAVAPGLNTLGTMLPHTPLHYLIFNIAGGSPDGTEWLQQPHDLLLVMTSANLCDEPLVVDIDEAVQRLGGIADAIVDHNRAIITRCDDSVMCITNGAPRFIRRSRSHVPQAIKLPFEIPSILAVGGQLKNTICVTRGNQAFLSQHIGDLDNRATYRFFEETVHHLLDTLEISPQAVAHDLHPDFFATRFAREFSQKNDLPTFAIQHHQAHLAAVAAEHGITHAALGLALDGFGLGEYNQSWGGELILLDGAHYKRLGHLAPLKQPGGDRAAREPWRMAASVYAQLNRSDEIGKRFNQPGADTLRQIIDKSINCPETSSAGRLFDAAAGLLGIQPIADYEGQAAMMLESITTHPEVMNNGWRIHDNQLDLLPLLKQLIDCGPIGGANLFHGTLIEALSDWIEKTALKHNIDTLLLGGGCFLNQVLTPGVVNQLTKKGLKVIYAQQVPTNDGGLGLGQAWIAGLNFRH